MSGFTIGKVKTGDDDEWASHTSVEIVNDGIRVYHYGSSLMGGGMGTYTPAKARELGQLLINAADRWSQLNADVKQAEAEIAAVNRTTAQRIKDFLA